MFKRKKPEVSTENKDFTVEYAKPSLEPSNPLLKEVNKVKKDLLPSDTITREQLLKELDKELKNRVKTDSNPFKTREDYFITFFNSNMQILKRSVPFEEIKIAGKSFLISKRFENGKIIIEEMFPYPQVEINLEDEFSNKESTKKQLEKINKYILYIKDQIAKGKEDYKLIDIEDLKEEKIRLEKILESIKYGKSAIFHYQDPVTNKKHLWLKKKNGEYNFLKITENNYIVEENNVRMAKGNQLIKRVEDITNMRKNLNFKGILISIAIFIAFCVLAVGLWKFATFDEVLFDKRVADAVGDREDYWKEQISFVTANCEDIGEKKVASTPGFDQVR